MRPIEGSETTVFMLAALVETQLSPPNDILQYWAIYPGQSRGMEGLDRCGGGFPQDLAEGS